VRKTRAEWCVLAERHAGETNAAGSTAASRRYSSLKQPHAVRTPFRENQVCATTSAQDGAWRCALCTTRIRSAQRGGACCRDVLLPAPANALSMVACRRAAAHGEPAFVMWRRKAEADAEYSRRHVARWCRYRQSRHGQQDSRAVHAQGGM